MDAMKYPYRLLRIPRERRRALILAAGFTMAACSSGSASNSPVPSASQGGDCSQTTTQPIGLHQMTSLGVTPADLLAYVSGTEFATLTWGMASPGQDVSVTPSGTTTLMIEVTPEDGGITYTQNKADAFCGPNTLAIAATVRFVSADGGFDETWEESLISSDGQSLVFHQDLQPSAMAGSFRVSYTGTEKWDSTDTVLTANFDRLGARGDVEYFTSQTVSTGPNSGAGGGLIVHAASWAPRIGNGGLEGASSAAGDAAADAARTD